MSCKQLILLAFLVGTAASDAAFAQQDDMPAVGGRIHGLAGQVSANLESVVALKDKATSEGSAIKGSCIDDKLRRLRPISDTAQSIDKGWATAPKNPTYGQRTLDRMSVLSLSAAALADEARNCTDAKDLTFELEVIVPPHLPDAPPGWPIATPPTFERPPLASPY